MIISLLKIKNCQLNSSREYLNEMRRNILSDPDHGLSKSSCNRNYLDTLMRENCSMDTQKKIQQQKLKPKNELNDKYNS